MEPVGYVLDDGAQIFCAACLPEEIDTESLSIIPVFVGLGTDEEECNECGIVLKEGQS